MIKEMLDSQIEKQMASNIEKLRNNKYPGRFIAIGMSQDGKRVIQVYAIMGRGEDSRNRIFVLKNGIIKTDAIDWTKVKNPDLIIYNALATKDKRYNVVSNGHQTDTIIQKKNLLTALDDWSYEPDAPSFTPRISGVYDKDKGVQLSIIKKVGDNAQTSIFDIPLEKGIGHCIHTYKGDGSPLPSFEGEPFIVPLIGSDKEIAKLYWDILNNDNKVALVVKSIQIQNYGVKHTIINKY